MSEICAIAIPTYKRSDRQITLELLEKESYPKEKIFLFIEESEKELYKKYDVNKVVLFPTGGNMAAINNQILDYMGKQPYLWTCDDVTEFKKLKGWNGKYWVYENCTFAQIAIDLSQNMLRYCSAIQIPTERRGVLKKGKKRYKEVRNLHTCYFVNPTKLDGIRFDERFRICEDYEFGYQLLLQKKGAVVDFQYSHNALHWENKGGCIEYRDEALAVNIAKLFKQKYSNHVKLIFNKTSKMVEARWQS